MKSLRPWARGLALLWIAAMGATAAAAAPAGAAAAPAGAAAAPAGSPGAAIAGRGSASPAAVRAAAPAWRARTVLRERLSDRIINQVVDGRAGADYALVPATVSPNSPNRLRRTDLATGAVRTGPEFPVSDLSLAAGYLWVSGSVPPQSTSFRLVLYQVNPQTLAVIRSWRLTPTRQAAGNSVKVAAAPGGTVWVGFRRTVLQINPGTGETIGRISLPSSTVFSDVATTPAHTRLYVSVAGIKSGGAGVLEYNSRGGGLIVDTDHHPLPSVGGAKLTAVPGGVWASFRTGMLGQTVLLRRSDLGSVPLSGGIFAWPMNATTVYGGGALWLVNDDNAVGCIAPNTGRVRHRRTLAELGGNGELLAVNAVSRVIYALGKPGVIAITPPRGCWG